MLSSSPDPLAMSTGPVVTSRTRQTSAATTPSKISRNTTSSTSAVNIHSPTKMTATSNSILSPWKIKVTVEAERSDDDTIQVKQDRNESPTRRRNTSRSRQLTLGLDDGGSMTILEPDEQPKPARKKRAPSVRTRTTTTKVPLKGIESSPEKGKSKEPVRGRKKTPAKKTVEPTEEEEEQNQQEKPKSKRKPRASTMGKSSENGTTATTATRRKRAKPSGLSPEETLLSFLDDDTIAEEQPSALTSVPTLEPAPEPAPVLAQTRSPKTTRKKLRASKSIPPTLASTRSRRSSLAPMSTSTPERSISTRNSSKFSVVDSGSRPALGGKDTNSHLSPSSSPSKTSSSSKTSIVPSNDMLDTIVVASPSIPTTKPKKGKGTSIPSRTLRSDDPKSLAISEGATLSLPEITAQQAADSSDDEDFGGDDTFADKSIGWVAPAGAPQEKYDFTYLSTGTSYTPRVRKKSGLRNEIRPSDSPPALGVKTFYGISPEKKNIDDQEEEEEEEEFQGSILPEELTGGIEEDSAAQQLNNSYERSLGPQSLYTRGSMHAGDNGEGPVEAEFTYMSHGTRYTPRTKKKGALSAFDVSSSIAFENSVTAESFYDLPSSSGHRRDKGKGKAVENEKGGLTPEESPENSSPAQPSKTQSFYASSPPSKEAIEADITEPDLPKYITPVDRNTVGPENPPLGARQRIERDTPNLLKVVEQSELLSDALEIDEAMKMAEQHFGNNVANNDTPPTPESRQDTPPIRPDGQEQESPTQGKLLAGSTTDVRVKYPSLDGIISPPPSQEAQAVAGIKASTQTPPQNRNKAFSHVRQSISGPSSLASSTSKSLKMDNLTGDMSRHSTAQALTPGSHSVRFAGEDSTETTTSEDLRNREESLEEDEDDDDMALDDMRQEFMDDAEDDEVMAERRQLAQEQDDQGRERSYIPSERTAILEAQWQAEREENARRAREEGALTILSDSEDERTSKHHFSMNDTERERSYVRRRAAEVGAITINDTTVNDDHDVSINNTTAFNASLARHIESADDDTHSSPFSLGVHASSSTRLPTFSRTPAPQIDLTTEAPSNSMPASPRPSRSRPSPKWTTEHYHTLALILKSQSTVPTTKRFSVMINAEMVPELIEPLVLDQLGLDEEGYMQLDGREAAAVERFLAREKKCGVKWPKTEVVRRVAGMRICAIRARIDKKRKEFEKMRASKLPR